MKFCTNCGSQVEEGAKTCDQCGKEIHDFGTQTQEKSEQSTSFASTYEEPMKNNQTSPSEEEKLSDTVEELAYTQQSNQEFTQGYQGDSAWQSGSADAQYQEGQANRSGSGSNSGANYDQATYNHSSRSDSQNYGSAYTGPTNPQQANSSGTYNYQANNQSYGQNQYSSPVKKNNTFAIISLVLGIVSLLLCCFIPFISILTSLAGVVLGILGLRQGTEGRVLAIVGIALSGISVILSILALIGLAAFMSEFTRQINY